MNEVRPLALVTGGMRRLGAAISARLAEAGYDLALSSHGESGPEPGLTDILATTGAAWHGFVADLARSEAPEQLLQRVSDHFGRVPGLLVNNAAMFGQDDWTTMDAASLEAHFRLNSFAPLLLSQALVKASSLPVAIVHIVDQRIDNPPRDQISYTLSKQALAASVRTMANAFGTKARVNAVAPGLVIATEEYDADQEVRIAGMMPLGTLPDAEGVADAVLYLASAEYVTGQIIYVDGGAHLKSYDRDFVHL